MATSAQLHQVLEVLRDRGINFRDFGKMLKDADMPTGRGWGELLPKYDAIGDATLRQTYLDFLLEVYNNHILYAERAVVVFKFEDGEVQRLIEAAPSWVDDASPFLASFPLPLSQENLGELSSQPIVTKVISDAEDGRNLVISCGKRYVRSRVPIDLNDYPDDTRDALAGYDEIFGVKSRYVQAFDVLMLDREKNWAVLSIDLCGNTSLDDIGKSVLTHVEWFDQRLSDVLLDGDAVAERVNFFPRIIGLYSEDDGTVEKVGHVTQSGSNKQERMRKKGTDLRMEPFHKKGLEAIQGGTDLFAISKRWVFGDHLVGVTIPGHFSQVNEEDPVISTALVDGCRKEQDFLFVLNKLVQ